MTLEPLLGSTALCRVDVSSSKLNYTRISGPRGRRPAGGAHPPRTTIGHPPPKDYHRSLGTGLLQSRTRGVFLKSEVPLQARLGTAGSAGREGGGLQAALEVGGEERHLLRKLLHT